MKRRNLLKFLPLSLLPLSSGAAAVSGSEKVGQAASTSIPDSGNSRSSDEKLWIVGEVYDYSDRRKWGFVGAFDTLERALDTCVTGNHFIAPAVLNDNFNDVVSGWPGGCFFPNQYSEHKRIEDLANGHELVLNRVADIQPIDTRFF